MSHSAPSGSTPRPRRLPRRPASALAERWTTVDGIDVFYRESVDPPTNARVMMHVHGFGMSGRYLLPTAERLQSEFHTLVPDLPGFGRSGKWVARYAIGNGMKVVYADNNATVDHLEVPFNGETVRVGVKMLSLEELLAKSDAITLHVPSKADGTPVLGADEFAKMKPGVILVNTARGNSIDEDALIAALKSGKVKSAGLDVYMNEPTPRADIMSLQNVSLSPHIGAATLEAQERIGGELAELLMAWREEVTVGRG